MSVSQKVIDFTNVKDRGQFNPRQVPVGDYLARVVKVEDGKAKSDDGFQYIFTIKLVKFSQNSYPYYCKLTENQLWKLRNLLIAAGMAVPKKRMKLDPSKIVGKLIGVTMEDDEYEGKMKSVIQAVFPANELDESELPDSSDDDVDDDEGDVEYADDIADDVADDEPAEEEAEVEPEEEADDEEEDEEPEAEQGDQFDEMDRNQLKRQIKKLQPGYSVRRSQSDDDLRQVARELSAADSDEDSDEDLDELEIEDL